jgi:hypothetical protein
MKITTKLKGGVWSARRHGFSGVFFGDTEEEAVRRANSSKPDHRAQKGCAAVWQPFVGTLYNDPRFQQNL